MLIRVVMIKIFVVFLLAKDHVQQGGDGDEEDEDNHVGEEIEPLRRLSSGLSNLLLLLRDRRDQEVLNRFLGGGGGPEESANSQQLPWKTLTAAACPS